MLCCGSAYFVARRRGRLINIPPRLISLSNPPSFPWHYLISSLPKGRCNSRILVVLLWFEKLCCTSQRISYKYLFFIRCRDYFLCCSRSFSRIVHLSRSSFVILWMTLGVKLLYWRSHRISYKYHSYCQMSLAFLLLSLIRSRITWYYTSRKPYLLGIHVPSE